MKWTLIKDLGKTCCNLQSKNKGVIKMSSFRGVASVLQGGEGRPQNVSKRGYSPDWHDNLHPVFCLKEGLKKKEGGPRAPQDPPSYVPVLWQQASLPTENFLLWLHPTHKIYQKVSDPWEQPTTPQLSIWCPHLSPPPPSLQRGVNTSLSLLQRSNPLGSLWIMNKLEEK